MTFDALHKLVKKNDIISLRRELDAGTSANLRNKFSWTLLMLAAMEGNLPIGELLISRGANVNAINDFGETALSLACCGGHVKFVRVLLANGAATNCEPHGQSLERWLRASSGLSEEKIVSVLELVNVARAQ